MKTEQVELLRRRGWRVECHNPLEIRREDNNSFASGLAARIVVDFLLMEEQAEEGESPEPPCNQCNDVGTIQGDGVDDPCPACGDEE